jgi:hypothetical protein
MIGSRTSGVLAACAVLAVVPAIVAAPSADEHQARGIRAFNNAKYQDAVDALKAAMALRPTAKSALYLGNAYLELGQLALAKEAFELVLKLEPNHPKKVELQNLIKSIEARTEVKVRVESSPAGATVYVDSESEGARGVTPVDLSLTVGKHVIILVHEGNATEKRDVVLKAGEPLAVNVPLPGKECEVSMSAKGAPAGARAAVDGGEAVALPAKILVKAGDHKVTFTAATFESKELPISCVGGAAGSLEATLTPLPGKLELKRAPGTIVKIDGKIVNVSEADVGKGLALAPGRHQVSVTVGDEPERTSIVDVKPGESVVLGMPDDAISSARFPVRALYVAIGGGANLALRDWKLGANSFRAQDGSSRLTPTSSGVASVLLGFQATARFAAEMEIMGILLPNTLDTSKALSWNANLLFHVLPTRWTPIVEAGGGFYQVVAGKLGSDWSPRGHLGLGLRGRVGKYVAIRIVARDVVSKGFSGIGSNNLELVVGAEALLF